MSAKSSFVFKISLTATTVTLAMSAPIAVGVSAADATSNLCQQVTTAEVSAALGVKVTKVTPDLNGSVTVCWYQVGSNPDAVYVRSSIGSGLSVFNLNKSQSKTQGEHPVNDTHFSPYSAFSTSLGSPSYGVTYGVVVLKKKNELDVGASKVSLAKVETLAKRVLPLL
jgi:uncharacterized membrane protein